ncbi:MAG TPA: peptidoglycan DD-metalloendopeptidase family protein [Herpetosiphonaceae bacterium]|nr:peptidoglycan DD-metalloendopeptidase family protein [Herpetosiphonaceae bacterium]
MFERFARLVAVGILGVALLLPSAKPTQAAGQPILYLPTPPGETWEIIQGYNCGTHDSWGRLSFDLVNSDGRTTGAPITAAADGEVFWHGGQTNSLILRHANGYYTMYSHMRVALDEPPGTPVARGQWIGEAGAVNPTPTVPHLHFTFFRADGEYANNRRAVPLAFAEGYNFPNTGKCNEHGGKLVVATGEAAATDDAPPTIEWGGSEAQTWLNAGTVEWVLSDESGVSGFSQAWDSDPAGDAPQSAEASGQAELDQPGVHTLFVRAWDEAGNQAVFTREVWFDAAPPTAPAGQDEAASAGDAADENADENAAASRPLKATWLAGQDDDSGVKGYQVYVGPDKQGTSDWFTAEPQISLDGLGPGVYLVRARTQDNAGNFSPWTTVQTVEVK